MQRTNIQTAGMMNNSLPFLCLALHCQQQMVSLSRKITYSINLAWNFANSDICCMDCEKNFLYSLFFSKISIGNIINQISFEYILLNGYEKKDDTNYFFDCNVKRKFHSEFLKIKMHLEYDFKNCVKDLINIQLK